MWKKLLNICQIIKTEMKHNNLNALSEFTALRLPNRLQQDQLVQDYNTALDETAGSGLARLFESKFETLIFHENLNL